MQGWPEEPHLASLERLPQLHGQQCLLQQRPQEPDTNSCSLTGDQPVTSLDQKNMSEGKTCVPPCVLGELASGGQALAGLRSWKRAEEVAKPPSAVRPVHEAIGNQPDPREPTAQPEAVPEAGCRGWQPSQDQQEDYLAEPCPHSLPTGREHMNGCSFQLLIWPLLVGRGRTLLAAVPKPQPRSHKTGLTDLPVWELETSDQ